MKPHDPLTRIKEHLSTLKLFHMRDALGEQLARPDVRGIALPARVPDGDRSDRRQIDWQGKDGHPGGYCDLGDWRLPFQLTLTEIGK